MLCDFCSEAQPRYMEDCETFTAVLIGAGLIGQSTGAWAACPTCHAMVQGRKWRHLQQRAVAAMLRKYPTMPKNRVQHGVELIHGMFRAHKPVESLNP
jgi:hypothetical protein